jgi:hypothetical protein
MVRRVLLLAVPLQDFYGTVLFRSVCRDVIRSLRHVYFIVSVPSFLVGTEATENIQNTIQIDIRTDVLCCCDLIVYHRDDRLNLAGPTLTNR